MHRLIVIAKNRDFPLLSDGVHSKAHPPASVPQRPSLPPTALAAGAAATSLEVPA